MNDSTPPEDGEPTSFAEKTKTWYAKHKPKVRVALGLTLAVGLGLIVVAHRHERQVGGRYDAEGTGDCEPVFDRDATDEPRRSFFDPDRDPFLRRLPDGQQASGEANARYRELRGCDLPPGYTCVRPWSYETAA
ncbi:hypothetical protein OHB41_50440 [Streptomyces sp. NBC_01571]|uniref:hypothetical protein n=1 Tax=Streptomyces sp. NBC_01571 TaxID=2975883 RepID=UPI0022530494|nr:hypothetical protein [Streptomyces sp. NBC_01571]MCX4581181.1 hypothetical protein [Streptomyces sp. NBC_01571]